MFSKYVGRGTFSNEPWHARESLGYSEWFLTHPIKKKKEKIY